MVTVYVYPLAATQQGPVLHFIPKLTHQTIELLRVEGECIGMP
jgi:hypothetical protein